VGLFGSTVGASFPIITQPTRSEAAYHPNLILLGFSAALAPKFPPSAGSERGLYSNPEKSALSLKAREKNMFFGELAVLRVPDALLLQAV